MGAVKEESSITEIASYDEWRIKVMEELNKPIILDCYADWCQPCKKLTPVLEQIAQQHEGKFKLVKLNIDNLPQLA
jgi:thioredoxin-like negative regulator of GroEL